MTATYDQTITLPRAVRFPVELHPPLGFDPERLETWPELAGRLEYVDGRLLFMPPCGDLQQDTVADVVITLGAWTRKHPDYLVATNEAGMRIGGATRAADAAIWDRDSAGPRTGGFRRTPPILAVEVAGDDEPEDLLRTKAAWYLAAGVRVVWLVFPTSRSVVVITKSGESRHGSGETLPEQSQLAGLAPNVDELFVQIDAR
jgi:Uma2 family endonuclease